MEWFHLILLALCRGWPKLLSEKWKIYHLFTSLGQLASVQGGTWERTLELAGGGAWAHTSPLGWAISFTHVMGSSWLPAFLLGYCEEQTSPGGTLILWNEVRWKHCVSITEASAERGEEGRRGKKKSQIPRFLSSAASPLLSWVVTSYGPLQPLPLDGDFRMDRNDWKILYVFCVCVCACFLLCFVFRWVTQETLQGTLEDQGPFWFQAVSPWAMHTALEVPDRWALVGFPESAQAQPRHQGVWRGHHGPPGSIPRQTPAPRSEHTQLLWCNSAHTSTGTHSPMHAC